MNTEKCSCAVWMTSLAAPTVRQTTVASKARAPSTLEAAQQSRDESTINRIRLDALESAGGIVTSSIIHNLLIDDRGFTAT